MAMEVLNLKETDERLKKGNFSIEGDGLRMGLLSVVIFIFTLFSIVFLLWGDCGTGRDGEALSRGSVREGAVDAAFACTEGAAAVCASNEVIVFRGSQWNNINLDKALGEGASSSVSARAWNEISDNWSFPEPFSKKIDAALPCPSGLSPESQVCRATHVFFFSGGTYIQYDLVVGKVVAGPTAIDRQFKLPLPFATQLDAAVPCMLSSAQWTPWGRKYHCFQCSSQSEVIFFKGSQYLVYDLASGLVVVPPVSLNRKFDAIAECRSSVKACWDRGSCPKALVFRADQFLRVDMRRCSLDRDNSAVKAADAFPNLFGYDKLCVDDHGMRVKCSVAAIGTGHVWRRDVARVKAGMPRGLVRMFSHHNGERVQSRRMMTATPAPPSSQRSQASKNGGSRKLEVKDIGAIAGAIVSILTIAVCLLMTCYLCCKKGRLAREPAASSKMMTRGSSFLRRSLTGLSAWSGSLTPSGAASTVGLRRDREYDYEVVEEATNGFNAINIIGRGACGMVYKGRLKGRLVAVKKLDKTAGPVGKGVYAELEVLGRVSDCNLVEFVGFVADGIHDVMLVFGFMPNASLFDHLHGRRSRLNRLGWEERMLIARGIAEGLHHLHTGCVPPLVHQDVKASNVLLDMNLSPRLADFGVVRLLCAAGVGATGSRPGTPVARVNQGYTDPSLSESVQPSPKSDVYAYGVLLFELITGQRPLDRDLLGPDGGRGLLEWARPHIMEGQVEEIIDKRLKQKYLPQMAYNIGLLAVACTHPEPDSRPIMSHVTIALPPLIEGMSWQSVAPLLRKQPCGPGDGLISAWEGPFTKKSDVGPPCVWPESFGYGGDSQVSLGANGNFVGSEVHETRRVENVYSAELSGARCNGYGYQRGERREEDEKAAAAAWDLKVREGVAAHRAVGSGYVTTRGWVGKADVGYAYGGDYDQRSLPLSHVGSDFVGFVHSQQVGYKFGSGQRHGGHASSVFNGTIGYSDQIMAKDSGQMESDYSWANDWVSGSMGVGGNERIFVDASGPTGTGFTGPLACDWDTPTGVESGGAIECELSVPPRVDDEIGSLRVRSGLVACEWDEERQGTNDGEVVGGSVQMVQMKDELIVRFGDERVEQTLAEYKEQQTRWKDTKQMVLEGEEKTGRGDLSGRDRSEGELGSGYGNGGEHG